ncbi:unnamed protein product [Ambrosiozyma monospora]|uniref:Unnamed protein product n=1 Tax=Ambrosiozyma monospora TaxID=43982 RepID=A0ACB5TZK0_AMBMO|nr:unnamed protein product [Ambrosiozyma monospora]
MGAGNVNTTASNVFPPIPPARPYRNTNSPTGFRIPPPTIAHSTDQRVNFKPIHWARDVKTTTSDRSFQVKTPNDKSQLTPFPKHQSPKLPLGAIYSSSLAISAGSNSTSDTKMGHMVQSAGSESTSSGGASSGKRHHSRSAVPLRSLLNDTN